MPNRFNIRIYALLMDSARQQVLVCDEIRFGRKFTKFPGGGLEFGEGIIDGLRREWMEETGLEFTNPSLFYINDFLQISAFKQDDQIISIYYLIDCSDLIQLELKKNVFEFETETEGEIIFRWVPLSGNSLPDQLTFPIDLVVAQKLRDTFQEIT